LLLQVKAMTIWAIRVEGGSYVLRRSCYEKTRPTASGGRDAIEDQFDPAARLSNDGLGDSGAVKEAEGVEVEVLEREEEGDWEEGGDSVAEKAEKAEGKAWVAEKVRKACDAPHAPHAPGDLRHRLRWSPNGARLGRRWARS
jgi:hypothetical protein